MKKTLKKVIVCVSICTMVLSLAACGNKAANDSNKSVSNTNASAAQSTDSATSKAFPKFTGKDLDGNAVDNSMFKDHAATVVNLWFTGCTACVQEMPDLEKLNGELKAKDVAVKGLLVDQDKNEEAKKILATKGVTYQNFVPDADSEIGDLLNNVFSFPTSYVIDRKGNIVGEPIVGTLNTEEQLKKLNERIEQAMENDK